ncbi:hypothetical protein [Legionella sp. CNM-4043-24]|uniref:hypothetical protein n=1 Tax=Legionella sp. CNM-4043-24 TaxID=3421646 RepID=UPI00403B2AA6
MSAVMYRLQSRLGFKPSLPNEQDTNCRWTFSSELSAFTANPDIARDFFRSLAKKHSLLALEYSVLCTQLTHDFFRTNRNDRQIMEQLATALMMAEILGCLYRDYLNVPREVTRLRNEQLVYRQLLADIGYQFDQDVPLPEKPSDWISQKIRTMTVSTNWLRLCALRTKKVLNAFVPLASKAGGYGKFVAGLDVVAAPFFSWLSWLFFLPRLGTNLFMLFKHLIPGWWMSDEEKALGAWSRFIAQLQRRWFELGNDALWAVAGLLGCFLLVGGLSPVGAYLNVLYYLYDVVLAVIRIALELNRLKGLQADYRDMALREGDPQKRADIEAFERHLQARYDFERKRLMVSVLNTTALLLALILCLPFMFSINPVLPLIGAVLIVTITIVAYYAAQEVEKQRPAARIASLTEDPKAKSLSRFGLFSSSSDAEQREPDVDDGLVLGL